MQIALLQINYFHSILQVFNLPLRGIKPLKWSIHFIESYLLLHHHLDQVLLISAFAFIEAFGLVYSIFDLFDW